MTCPKFVYIFGTILLAGCAAHEVPVTTVATKEVKVPVSTPCVQNKPDRVVPLREQLTRDQWDGLSTDQREKLLGAQALDHLVYGDKLDVATAGCR